MRYQSVIPDANVESFMAKANPDVYPDRAAVWGNASRIARNKVRQDGHEPRVLIWDRGEGEWILTVETDGDS